MRRQRSSGSGSTLAPLLVALSLLGSACGDDSTDLSGRDGGPDGGPDVGQDAGAPESCDMRCEPEESLSKDCRCTQAGVRMRLGELSDGFFAQPWPLRSRLSDDGTLVLTDFPYAPG